VAIGPDGSLYIADTDHSCVRRVDPQGLIWTVAGICGTSGRSGDLGPATSALLARPFGIEVDAKGTLYIADTYNHRIRIVHP
jgi:streptogramin lyase